jgi:hypothetical protein
MNKSGIGNLLNVVDQAVDARSVFKCPACKLQQFGSQDGTCKRCGVQIFEVDKSWPELKKLRKQTDWRALPSSWLPVLYIMLRHSQGLSMGTIARRMKLPRQNITRLEHENLNLELRRVPKIAEAYGTTPEHLMRMVEYLITGR